MMVTMVRVQYQSIDFGVQNIVRNVAHVQNFGRRSFGSTAFVFTSFKIGRSTTLEREKILIFFFKEKKQIVFLKLLWQIQKIPMKKKKTKIIIEKGFHFERAMIIIYFCFAKNHC